MEQPISRRRILAWVGSGAAGAAVAATPARSAAADTPGFPRTSLERSYRPLALPGSSRARIQSAGTGGAQVDAALDSASIPVNRELVIHVRASVANDLLGERRVLRTMMVGDNGDLRMETVGPEVRIDDPSFELDITLGRGDPIQDWNLIPERIFAVRVSLDVLGRDDFAVSDDYLFKVRRR